MKDKYLENPPKRLKMLFSKNLVLLILIVFAFLVGRLGKQYYLKNPAAFEKPLKSFAAFWTKKGTTNNQNLSEEIPKNTEKILYLLDVGDASQVLFQQKSKLSYFIEAFQTLETTIPKAQSSLWLYGKSSLKEDKSQAKWLSMQSIETLSPKIQRLLTSFAKESRFTLKEALQAVKKLSKEELPHKIVILCYGINETEEDVPFEVIDLTEIHPQLSVSLIKFGVRNRDTDFGLFQIVNEGTGKLFWVQNASEIHQTMLLLYGAKE